MRWLVFRVARGRTSGLALTWLVSAGCLWFAGCQTKPERDFTPAVARFVLEADAGRTVAVVLPMSGVTIEVMPKPVFSEFDLANVEEAQVELGRCLLFQLSPAAARDLYRLSAANQGRRLVLLLDGHAVGARVIERPLGSGEIFTFVEIPDAELPALVQRLKQTIQQMKKEAAK